MKYVVLNGKILIVVCIGQCILFTVYHSLFVENPILIIDSKSLLTFFLSFC